ncbi:MAG: hypothetical protein CRN43_21740 [Candidatus Nephrothrix sp. EaCA]|nr:MAG: hypothetical protein CRN43_21740 [Candidatus Nephrothrix sp. EaCA]
MKNIKAYHRFIDEAGDTAFYTRRHKKNAVGQEGVSKCFIIGMLKVLDPLDEVREKINRLQKNIVENPYFKNIPSIQKKLNQGGYFLHATDDIPEVRMLFYELIKTINCSFEAVMARKEIERYETKHKGKQEYFYADLLSHLLKNKFLRHKKLVLNISARGKSTKHTNLNDAVLMAQERFKEFSEKKIITNFHFEVNTPTKEPILSAADYLCWALQKVFEKGEMRYYEFIQEKISLVVDLYDAANFRNQGNYYTSKGNPLTSKNKIDLPLP